MSERERQAAAAAPLRPDATTLGRDAAQPLPGSTSPPAIGQRPLALDATRYAIGELLGEGGMGEVRRCFDRAASRDVALKLIRPDADVDDVEQRFLREARVQARLAHPGVVPVYDVARDMHGQAYFTMKRVEGVTLDDVVQTLREDPQRTELGRHRLLSAFARACLTVDYAHARGVLHRDLKPANVMLGAFGEVYVLDWGLAKIIGAGDSPAEEHPKHTAATAEDPTRTARGIAMGTPAYMAPEQAAARSVDARTDVFALGAILFEILALEQLLDEEQLRAGRERRPYTFDARPSTRAPSWQKIPPELDAICVKATAPDPHDRYPSARALHEAVEAFLAADDEEGRRVRLAAEHLERARSLSGPDAADAWRPAALEELGSALALAPEDEETRRTLVQLLRSPPRETPEEVKTRQLQHEVARMRRMQRLVATIYAAVWLFAYPVLMFAGGIESLAGALAIPIAWIATAFAILVTYRLQLYRRKVAWTAIVGAVALATTSLFWGPLFIVPTLAVAMVFGHILIAPRSHRPQIVIFTCLAIAVPAYLAFARIIDVYTPAALGNFLVHGVVGMNRPVFFAGLTLAHLFVLIFGARFAARYRDVLDARVLENALFSWQLTNLVPRATNGSKAPRATQSIVDAEEANALIETATPPLLSAKLGGEEELFTDLDAQRDSGRYVEREKLDDSDLETVWRCRDRRLGREVEMHVASDAAHDDAIRLQARLRGRLEHPTIAPLYDVGVTELGRSYFTAKHVRGVSLSALLVTKNTRHGRRLLTAFGQVCLGVAYAHECGVAHGAIDSEVIILGSFGEVHLEGWIAGGVDAAQADIAKLGGVLQTILRAGGLGSSAPELEILSARAMNGTLANTRAFHEAIEAFLSGDRDAEVRHQLAMTHLELAQRAADRAFGGSTSPSPLPFEDQAHARVEALREIGRAVRLEPEEPQAVRLLLRLITEPPARPPPEVVLEVDRLRQVRARGPAIATLLFGALWLFLYPAVAFLLGVRQLLPVLAVWISWALGEVVILLSILRPNDPRFMRVPWSMFAMMLAGMMMTALSGPFFITPVIATVATMAFVLVVPRQWRTVTIVVGMSIIALPAVLAWTGIYVTADVVGTTIVSASALQPPSHPTGYLVLTVVHLLAILFAAEYAARFRERLDHLETAFLVRTWQLTRLLPQKQRPEMRSPGVTTTDARQKQSPPA